MFISRKAREARERPRIAKTKIDIRMLRARIINYSNCSSISAIPEIPISAHLGLAHWDGVSLLPPLEAGQPYIDPTSTPSEMPGPGDSLPAIEWFNYIHLVF
jgi:hypothetical protein